MEALFDLLEEEERKDLWRLYMAQGVEGMRTACGYQAMAFAEIIGLTKPDTQTGEEIMDSVLGKLDEIARKEKA